jgi:hypothetical protein
MHTSPSRNAVGMIRRFPRTGVLLAVAGVGALLCSVVMPALVPSGAATRSSSTATPNIGIATTGGFTVTIFALPPRGTVGPDDLSVMNGNVFVAYQNGVGTMGEASTTAIIPGSNPPKIGTTQSTIAEFSLSGSGVHKPIATWLLSGKIDGMTTQPSQNRVLASVNEDGNSSFYTVPATAGSTPQHYTCSPDPSSIGGGGTDQMTAVGDAIYIAGSAPSAANAPALYSVSPQGGTAKLTPVFLDNASATGPNGPVTLALTDPDTDTLVPSNALADSGQVALVSQSDNEIIFAQNPGAPNQTLTQLPVGASIDGLTYATKSKGSLLLTDNSNNRLYAITGSFTTGGAYVSTASDSTVTKLVGSLDLMSGAITPIAIGFSNPHAMIFVPSS